MSELRNFDNWSKSLQNFDWLKQATTGATDIDVFIERHGRFIFIEGKEWRKDYGLEVPYGQHKALYTLSKQPNTTVYLVGETPAATIYVANVALSPKPEYIRSRRTVWWRAQTFQPVSKDDFTATIREWWEDKAA